MARLESGLDAASRRVTNDMASPRLTGLLHAGRLMGAGDQILPSTVVRMRLRIQIVPQAWSRLGIPDVLIVET